MRVEPIEGFSRTPFNAKYPGSKHQFVSKQNVIIMTRTEITDERASSLAERQTEAPEEPLEAGDGDGDDAEEDQAEGILATEQARVEEAETGNHDPDERHGREDPCDVTEVVDDGLACLWVDPVEVGG